jgi:proteasome assembly chaperone (PAC2) family protein
LGIILRKKPRLENPDLIASWPGIGKVGSIAIDTLRKQVGAEEMGEIEPWEFFYPRQLLIRADVLEELRFPASKFYYTRRAKKDLIFFIGDEQPSDAGRTYAEGRKAYRLANMVLDVAEKLGCRRVYTSGAAVTSTHHLLKPRVWAVTSRKDLIKEVRSYPNTILMGEVEGRSERGNISGLNGLLVGLAKKRGLESVCLMGEVPDYLSGASFPYPRASESVLEVLARLLGINVNYDAINEMASQIEHVIDSLYQKFPPEMKHRIERRKSIIQPQPETITDEDERWIKEHIDELLKEGGGEDEGSV